MSFEFSSSGYVEARKFAQLRQMQQSDPYFSKLLASYRHFSARLQNIRANHNKADPVELRQISRLCQVLHTQLTSLICEVTNSGK